MQDFYNLVDVYLDAVLHPRCVNDKRTFEQEGWHLELDDPKDPLTYKGVVFNEMKGVYSSPDSMFYRVVQQVSGQQPATCCCSYHLDVVQAIGLLHTAVWCA